MTKIVYLESHRDHSNQIIKQEHCHLSDDVLSEISLTEYITLTKEQVMEELNRKYPENFNQIIEAKIAKKKHGIPILQLIKIK